jgi:hypothetical protein
LTSRSADPSLGEAPSQGPLPGVFEVVMAAGDPDQPPAILLEHPDVVMNASAASGRLVCNDTHFIVACVLVCIGIEGRMRSSGRGSAGGEERVRAKLETQQAAGAGAGAGDRTRTGKPLSGGFSSHYVFRRRRIPGGIAVRALDYAFAIAARRSIEPRAALGAPRLVSTPSARSPRERRRAWLGVAAAAHAK